MRNMFDQINKITVLEEKINRNAVEMKNLKQENERLNQTSKEQDERLIPSILYAKVKKFMIIARAPRLEPEACRGF
jgi:hypothetical protein